MGARLAGEVAARHGDCGFCGELRLELAGSAGQSLGAFLIDGLAIELTGEANDYVGKGMAGGEIVLRPAEPRLGGFADVIAGNTCLYGATGGRFFAAGRAGERFAVRNSAATAVVEGAGDHCCEYMTGGVVAVLGSVGRNACAGMTGGTVYLLADERPAWLAGHGTVAGADMDSAAVAEVTALLADHLGPDRERRGARSAGRSASPREPLRPGPPYGRPGPLRGARVTIWCPERGASVTQAQQTLVAYAQTREYAPGEIRGAGVGPATCPERRPHGDRGLLRQVPHQAAP